MVLLSLEIESVRQPFHEIEVLLRLEKGNAEYVPLRHHALWTAAGLRPPEAPTMDPRYSALGAVGDAVLGLFSAGGVDFRLRGTESWHGIVDPGRPSSGAPEQEEALGALEVSLASGRSIRGLPPRHAGCSAPRGGFCDGTFLLHPASPVSRRGRSALRPSEPLGEGNATVVAGFLAPASPDRARLVVYLKVYRAVHAREKNRFCGLATRLSVDLPEGPSMAARIERLLAAGGGSTSIGLGALVLEGAGP